MNLQLVLFVLLASGASCQHHRGEEEETRVLSAVWDAMEKHKGDDIIVIPNRGEKSEKSGPGPRETESQPKGPEQPKDGPSHGEGGPSGPSGPRGPMGPGDEKSSVSSLIYKLNRLGDIMGRAVDQLRNDDAALKILANGQARTGFALSFFDIVAAVILGIIVIAILGIAINKGIIKFRAWRERRRTERLVDQEAPNMDGTGYQSGYNP